MIGGEEDVCRRVQTFLAELVVLSEFRRIAHYPEEAELARVVRVLRPNLVLVHLGFPGEANRVRVSLNAQVPHVPVAGLSTLPDPRLYRELHQQGFEWIIQGPLSRLPFQEALRELLPATQQPAPPPFARLFSFLPSKGGVGTSVMACHFALALAKLAGKSNQRALLLDLDLSSGLSRVLFQCHETYTLVQMLETGASLSEAYWPRFTTQRDHLDIISGGRSNPRRPIMAAQIRDLLALADRRYAVICADLSGNQEVFALETLRQSSGILMVITPDLNALRLAQERVQFLKSMDLAQRVALIVNRVPDSLSISASRLENEIGCPVAAEFDFEDRKIREALIRGQMIAEQSSLGKHIQRMAERICWDRAAQHAFAETLKSG